MNKTTKPAKNIHKRINTITKTLSLGENVNISAPSLGFGVSVTWIGSGVEVAILVTVAAGNIKVIAGRGINVVVGISVGAAAAVPVSDGVPSVLVGL